MSESARGNDIPSVVVPETSTIPEYVTKSAIFKQWSELNDGDEIVAYSKTFMKPDHELQFMNHITKIQKANKKSTEKRKAVSQIAIAIKNHGRKLLTMSL